MQLPIEQVIVHRDGARVRRVGSLNVINGQVVITGLPLMLHEASIRVSCGSTTVLSVSLDLDVEGIDRGPPPEAMRAVRELEQQVVLAQAEVNAGREQLAMLDEVAPAEPSADASLPSAERLAEWAKVDGVFAAWMTEVLVSHPTLVRKLARLREALDVARNKAVQVSGADSWRHWAPTRRAVVTVDGTGDVDVEIEYRVPGACWTPAYALHVNPDFRTGRLVLRALVVQATGEDWGQVSLALSTAPMVQQVDAPTLKARRLGRAQPPSRPAWRSLPSDLESLFPMALESGAVPRERGRRKRVQAPDAFGSDDNATAVDTEVPRSKRRARRAASTPPPAVERNARARSVQASQPEAFAAPAMEDDGIVVVGSLSASAARKPKKSRRAPIPAPLGDAPVIPKALDYGSLRIASWDAAPGTRGRLTRLSLIDQALAAGVPADAVGHVERAQWTLERLSKDVAVLPVPAHHSRPSVRTGADFRYEMEGRADIPADSQWHSVSLVSEPLELRVQYRLIAREDPRVFRSLSATMVSAFPLLPGPVDVYVGGRLELTTPWQGSGQDSPIELGLGPEDAIRVARNVRYREESTGLFGGGRRVHAEVELTVASSLPREISVEVFDRIPVAGDDSVVVLLESAEPTASPWSGEPGGPALRGGLRQQLHIPPGGESKATLHWHMSIGSKYEVDGGERRGN
ncbi:MAG: hypothetical protein ACJAZO_004599 [Myxococcota bacterium]